jgi:hypothetical protein
MVRRTQLHDLRDQIASAVAGNVKAYDIPGFCIELGLQSGDGEEAFRSKAVYVKKRLAGLDRSDLIRVATDVLVRMDHAALADMVEEMTVHANCRVSEITRRDVLKTLNGLHPLFYASALATHVGPDRRKGAMLRGLGFRPKA